MTPTCEATDRSQPARRGRIRGTLLAAGLCLLGGTVTQAQTVLTDDASVNSAQPNTNYGLKGTLTFTVAGRRTDVRPGDIVCIPRGVVHRFDNFSAVDASMLAIITPGILGPDYFREIAAVVNAAAGGPPDPAAIAAVMLRHGLTPVP